MAKPCVFISYSHADEEWRQRLVAQLGVLELQGTFRTWDDRQIPTGGDWRAEIDEQMAAAEAAVLLISVDSLTSKFILENEVPVLLERRERDGLRVFPLIVRPTNPGEVDWLAGLQWQPPDGQDLLSMFEASEASAERLLAEFAKEIKDSFGDGAARSGSRPASPAAPAASAAPVVSTARLPATGETFVARAEELATLDAAWEDGTHLISFVAMGGAGKSALVNAWLGRMQVDGWRGAERVLGWSFYSQGTEGTSASSDNFTAYALEWLGYDGEPITSPWLKGETIARLVRQRRTLLLLDGLEPLQHPPGAKTGDIKDPAVQALVRELAADNPGLCVITSRLPVADVAGRPGTVAVDLEALSPEAGAELLRRLGVEGSDAELRAAAEELGGHGLALTLLGTYLRDVLDGDVRRRGEVRVLDEAVEIDGSEHARRMLEGYAAWFGDGPELRVLRLLGLFDRPAEAAALAALRAAPEIPGLSEGVGEGNETAWKLAVARLRKARLVAAGEAGGGGLDAHPLVREYFGARLARQLPEAWREGNRRLYEHYRQVPEKDLPDTLDELLPLYAAVVHGCRAGRVQEACDEVYWRRIHRGNESYSLKKLGAFGAELTALAAFFERPWERPSAQLRRGGPRLVAEPGRLRPPRPGAAGGGGGADAGRRCDCGIERRGLEERRDHRLQPQRADPDPRRGGGRRGGRRGERGSGRQERRRLSADDQPDDAGRRPAPGGPPRGELGGLPRRGGDAGGAAAALPAALLAPGLPVLRPAARRRRTGGRGRARRRGRDGRRAGASRGGAVSAGM